ncbi:MAG: sigma 54-interacting transcriptional regulator [Nitrosospira sp.]
MTNNVFWMDATEAAAKRVQEIGSAHVDQNLNNMPTHHRRDYLPSRQPRGKVVVWDRRTSRREFLDSTLLECGLNSLWISCRANFSEIKVSAKSCVAIVALEHQLAPDSSAFNAILSLKQLGFDIVAYGYGVQTWPLSTRGKVLTSGAACVLDSADVEFVNTFQYKVAALLVQRAEKSAKVDKTKAFMRSLGIIGESEATFSLFEQIMRIAPLSDLPVLITGESGTGKELVAQAIHRLDPKRCHGPFIPVNCGAISATLAESELFGHKKGAFTGADRERRGLFPSANGGTLFLDEIGELRSDLQAKLLRVLQERAVLNVGADREVPVDFRIIAATNRDLGKMVGQNEFRADLFHRLNVLTLCILPLRERKKDLQPLIESFLNKYRTILPDSPTSVKQDFIETLASLELPGNVRQLENILLRLLVNKIGSDSLDIDDLPLDIWKELNESSAATPLKAFRQVSTGSGDIELTPEHFFHLLFLKMEADTSLSKTMHYCEKFFLEEVLRHTHGNQSQAARLLGITARSVYNKVKEYHLEPKPEFGRAKHQE